MLGRKNSEFIKKIDDLIEEFEKSSDPGQKKLASFAKQAQETHKALKESFSNLQESLDYLRVCIKYIVFDLEATRRENEYLRRLLAGEEDEDVAEY